MNASTITLWRPVGPNELRLIEDAGMAAFPPSRECREAGHLLPFRREVGRVQKWSTIKFK